MLNAALCLLTLASPFGYRERVGPAIIEPISVETIEKLPIDSTGTIADAIVKYTATSQVYGTNLGQTVAGHTIVLRNGRTAPNIVLDSRIANPAQPHIAMETIDKIEILTGGYASMYGSSSGAMHFIRSQKTLETELNKRRQVIDPNLNLQPNGWTTRTYGFDRMKFEIQYDFQKEIRFTTISQERTENLGSFAIPLGEYDVPRQNPLISETFVPDSQAFDGPDDQKINSIVGGLSFTNEYREKLGVGGLTLPWAEYKPGLKYQVDFTRYLGDATKQYGTEFTTNIIARSGLGINQIRDMFEAATLQGQDMNSLMFPGDPSKLGDVRCGSDFHLPTSTLLVPDRSGYQMMSTIGRLRYDFLGPIAGIDFQDIEQKEIPTHCINMELKEPEPGVRFYPYYNPDPVLRGLMELTERARFRGPWLQARTWIYTDKAPISDINKRLIPPISNSRYVNGLFDVAALGGFSEADLGNPKLFDPSLIASPFAEDNAFAWFVNVMANKHGKPLRTWLERNPKEIADLIVSDEEDDMLHLTRMFGELFLSGSADVRMGALGLLSKIQSGTERLRGKLGVPYASLASEDAKEVELALSCVEKFCNPLPKASLAILAKHGKTDAIKKKATELAGR
jgi:hypothetical protein